MLKHDDKNKMIEEEDLKLDDKRDIEKQVMEHDYMDKIIKEEDLKLNN